MKIVSDAVPVFGSGEAVQVDICCVPITAIIILAKIYGGDIELLMVISTQSYQ